MLREEASPKQVNLIRHTYRLIGDKGMDRMTLQDVADSAGVSKAAIVYYFKSKENLVLKTMGWVLDQVADRVQRAIATAGTPEDRVRAMIDAIFVDAKRNRNFYLAYIDLVDYAARNDRFNELSTTFRSIVNSLYAQVILSGAEEGAFGSIDVAKAATVVRAIIDGLFLQWLQEEQWKKLYPGYKATCTEAVLAYLRASPRAR